MAEAAAAAPKTQEDYWKAGYEALNPKVELFLKNKSEYADLYTYVQIFRKAAAEIGGNPGVDTIHAYMVKEANAKRLGLPSKLRNKQLLNKLYGQARTYTAVQGSFPQPADVRNAYAEYEKKNVVDKKDADKKVKDTEKEINEKKLLKKRSKRKSRNNWWGWALSHLGRAALVVGAIVAVSSLGVGAGIFATLGAAAQIGVGATAVGVSAFGVWGLGRVKDACWTKRAAEREKIAKIGAEIEDLRDDLRKAKEAQGKIDTRLAEDSAETLVDYPEEVVEEIKQVEKEAAKEAEKVEEAEKEAERAVASERVQPPSERKPIESAPEERTGGREVPVPTSGEDRIKRLKIDALKNSLEAGKELEEGYDAFVCGDIHDKIKTLDEEQREKHYPTYLVQNGLVEVENDSIDDKMNKMITDIRELSKLFFVSSLSDDEVQAFGVTPKEKAFIDRLAYRVYSRVEDDKVHRTDVKKFAKSAFALYEESGKRAAMKAEDDRETIETIRKSIQKDTKLSQLIINSKDDSQLRARKTMLIHALSNDSIAKQLTEEEKAKCLRMVYDLNRERGDSPANKDDVIESGIKELSKPGGLFEAERKARVAFAVEKLSDSSLKPEKLSDEDLSMLMSIMQDKTIAGKSFDVNGKEVLIDRSRLMEIAFDASKTREGKEIKDEYLKKQLSDYKASDDYKVTQESKDVNAQVETLIAYDYIKSDGSIDEDKVKELLAVDALFEADKATGKRKADHLSNETKNKLKQKIAEVLMAVDTDKKITEKEVKGVKISSVELSDKYKDAVKNITAYDTKSKSKTEKSLGVILNGVAGDDKAEYYKKLNAENAIFARDEEKVKKKNEKGVEVVVIQPRLSTRLRKKILSTSLKDDKEISKILGDMKEGLEHPEKLSPRDKLIYRAFIYKLKDDKASIPLKYKGAVGKFYKGANVLESDQFERITGTKADARGLGYIDEKGDEKLLDLAAEDAAYESARASRKAKRDIKKIESDAKKEVKYISKGNNFYYATIHDLLQKKKEYAYDARMQIDIDKKIAHIVKEIEGAGLDIDINEAWSLDIEKTGKVGYLSEEEMKSLNLGVLREKRMEIVQSCFKSGDKGALSVDPSQVEIAKKLIGRIQKSEEGLSDKEKTDLSKFINAIEKNDNEVKKAQNEEYIEILISTVEPTYMELLPEKDVKANYEKMLEALDLELVGDDKKKKLFDHIVKYKMQADKTKKASAIDTMRGSYKDKYERVDAEIVKRTIEELSATVTADGKPVTELSDEQFTKLDELQKYLDEKGKLGAKVEIDPALKAKIDGLKTAYENKKAEEAKINGFNSKILEIKGASDLVKAEDGKLVLNEGLDPEKINVIEYLEGYMEAINGESDVEFVDYAIAHLKEVLGSELFKNPEIQTKLQEYKNEMTRLLKPEDKETIDHLRKLGLYPTEEELKAEEARRVLEEKINNALEVDYDEAWDDDVVEQILKTYEELLSDAGLTDEQRENLKKKKQSIEETQTDKKSRTERVYNALNITYDDATFEETLSSLDDLIKETWLTEDQKTKLEEKKRELEEHQAKKQAQDEAAKDKDDRESISYLEITEEDSLDDTIQKFAQNHYKYYDGKKGTRGNSRSESEKRTRIATNNTALNNIEKAKKTINQEQLAQGLPKINFKEFDLESYVEEISGSDGAVLDLMEIMATGKYEDKTLSQNQRVALAELMMKVANKRLNVNRVQDSRQSEDQSGSESGS